MLSDNHSANSRLAVGAPSHERTETDPLLSTWQAGLFLFLVTFAGSVWARWLGSQVLDFAPVWPAAGIALATVIYRPALLLAVAAGLLAWSLVAQSHSLTFSLVNLLTLTGAIMFGIFFRRQKNTNPNNRIMVMVSNYRSVLILAVMPASLIGTFIYAQSYNLESILDIFFIYMISEAAGIALFYPVIAMLLANRQVIQELLSSYVIFNLAVIVSIALLPLVLHGLNREEYAEGAFLLIFPAICWIAIQNNRSLMAAVILVFTVGHLMLEAFGVGLNLDASVFELVERVIWLLAACFAGDVLLAYSLGLKKALDKARWQATHNEVSGWLNPRGLEETVHSLHDAKYDIIIAQVCRRDLLVSSLRYTELKEAEKALAMVISSLHEWPVKAHLSDLTYCFIVPSNQPVPLEKETFQSIRLSDMDITLKLAWSRVPLKQQDMDASLVELYSGLQISLGLPANRYLVRTTSEQSLVATESNFDHYQRVVAAIEQGQLQLWAQPIHAVDGGKPSVELLSRIKDGTGGLLSPAVFLDALNAFDELEILDRAVILAAIAANGPVQSLLPHFGRININLSGSTLCDIRFTAWLNGVWPADLPKDKVCFELTESELIRNLAVAKKVYSALRESGFQTAIDDFGSGLASYEYLEHFPANLIKLDGFVIRDLLQNSAHFAMVKGTATIVRSLGSQLCAEFVGCEATAELLAKEGVHYLQGFYIAKPVPVTELYKGWTFQNPN